MAKLVTALFRDRASAMNAIDNLVQNGFNQDDITLLMSETTRGRDFTVEEQSKAPEGMASGAAIGGVLGALALGLTSVGLMATPGLGIFAVGYWLPMLTGFGAGALGGGLLGGLIGLGIPEHEAKFYHGEIDKGGILLGLYSADESEKDAKELLDKIGGEHVRSENVKDLPERTDDSRWFNRAA